MPGDFDGDGKADIGFFSPSTGEWHVLRSSSDNMTSIDVSWGLSTDVPMPGDYDGDGKTDPAVFRPSTGGWYVLKSSTSYTTSMGVSWGLSTDRPMPGDYDGDGKIDPAIYRPSTGLWAILKSSVNYTSGMYVFWGLSTDTPMPADYDGDGKIDPAIYRPSTGLWAILKSSVNYASGTYVFWGLSTDVPVPGDYDGDGKTDPAIYRPTTGLWAMLSSGAGYGSGSYVTLGVSADMAAPADYDGDGRTDPAVFTPTTGLWSILKSAQPTWNPAHLWTFDEPLGDVAIDAVSPGAVNGAVGSGAHRITGMLGAGALQFEAYDPDGYVNIPASVAALGTSDFTISFWMTKAPDPTGWWGTLVGNRGGFTNGPGNFVQFYADDSTITFEISQATSDGYLRLDTGAFAVTDGLWHKITGVRAGSSAWLYVDGFLQASGTAPDAVTADVTNAFDFSVGVNDYERAHPELNCGCRFDDVRIYNRALAALEVPSNAIYSPSTPFTVPWGNSTDVPLNKRP